MVQEPGKLQIVGIIALLLIGAGGCGSTPPTRFGTVIRTQADADTLIVGPEFAGLLIVAPDPEHPIRFEGLVHIQGSLEIEGVRRSMLEFPDLETIAGTVSVTRVDVEGRTGSVAFPKLVSVEGAILVLNAGGNISFSALVEHSDLTVAGFADTLVPELEHVETLDFDRPSSGSFFAPKLARIDVLRLEGGSIAAAFVAREIGRVDIKDFGGAVDFPVLERVTEQLGLSRLTAELSGRRPTFPQLEYAERLTFSPGYLDEPFLVFPALTAAGEISTGSFSAPLLREVDRDFELFAYRRDTCPLLERVGGDLRLHSVDGSSVEFDGLVEVGGSLLIERDGVALRALRVIGGDLELREAFFSVWFDGLEEIHGRTTVDELSQDVQLDMPELLSLGHTCTATAACVQTVQTSQPCSSIVEAAPFTISAFQAPKLVNVAGSVQFVGECEYVDLGGYENALECGPICSDR